MAEISKQALQVDNNQSFPNNNAGAITPSDLRAFNVNMIDSLVDEITYNQDSASWNQSIDALEAFTSSQQPTFNALNQFTASQLVINSGVNAFTQSADARLDALESETQNLELFTASVNEISDNGIVQGTSTRLHFYGLVSASIVPNVNGAIASINIEQDGTKLNSASFNSYTASTDSDLDSIHQTTQSLNNFTASLTTAFVSTASFNAYTQSINSYTSSNDAKVNSLINATASYATSAITASSLVTASVNLNTITFTKGDSSTFNITVNTGSGGATTDITSLNAFTASQDTKNTTLANVTASLNASTASQQSQIDNLIAATGSYAISSSVAAVDAGQQSQIDALIAATGSYSTSSSDITSLNAFTASQETKNSTLATYTASVDTKFSTLGTQSGSWITESETASFARTNVDNNFTANQTFTNITAVSASFQYVQTTYETSSVIYSSGSNQFGDASDDVQTLYGSVRVVNELTASGLNYPNADNGAKAFMQTDGAGNLSLQYVDAMFETVRNMSGVALDKGTPVYISGSTGDNGNAYVADASDLAKMPAVYILGEDLIDGATGIALVGGLIEGVDTTGYPAGTIIYVAEGGGWSDVRPSGSTSIVQVLGVVQKEGVGGQGVVINQLEATLPNIQTGYAWVGNGSNQPVQVATSSFGTPVDLTSLNAFTQSQDTKNTTLENVTSSLQSYTASQNTINTDVSASASIYEAKFDTIGTQSGSWVGSSIDTGSFATTGSNIFVADQIITGSAGFLYSNGTSTKLRLGTSENLQNFDFRVTGSGLEQQLWLIENQGGVWGNSFFNRMYVDSNLNVNSTFTASLQEGYAWVGNASGKTSTVATSSFGGASLPSGLLSSSVTNFTDYSASVDTRINNIVTGTGFATTGSNTFTGDQNILGTLTASLQEGYVWAGGVGNISTLVATSSFAGGGGTISVQDEGTILGNATSFDFNGAGVTATLTAGTASITIPGGGGSIDTGSFATTGSNTFTGDQTLIDASGNFFTISDASGSMMLVAKTFTSASAHLTASVGGKVNIIFKDNNNTADTIISGSNNIFVNPAAPTAGFKRYVGTNNIYNSTGLPQISQSMAFPVTMTGNIGPGSVTMRGPVSSSAWTINNNNLIGSINVGIGALNRAERIVSGLTMSGNSIQGSLSVIAQQNDLTSSVIFSNNSMNGFLSLNLNSSSANIQNNIINDNNLTITNNYYTGSEGRGQITVSRNTIGGQTNTILVTGIGDAGTSAPFFTNNTMGGQNNTIFSNSTGAGSNTSAIANIIFGNTLIVTGSNGGTTYGSAFFGRFNANDGIRNKTSDVVLAVGTGTNGTTGRKTGFLIDSNSNTFVEGTLNVSGSTILTGSIISVDSSGNATNTIIGLNALGMGSAGASPLAVGNTISIAIGNGAMRFASGSSQNVAIGNNALALTTGSLNFALGSESLTNNTTGTSNVAIGVNSLNSNSTGNSNVSIGNNSGFRANGNNNTYIGESAGYNITGSNNLILGRYQGSSGEAFDNNIILADGSGTIEARFDGDWQFYDNVNVTGSINVVSGSLTGQAVTNITPESSSLSPILNIVTLTTAEYALITPNSQTLYVIV
jgi:hypothetical protein